MRHDVAIVADDFTGAADTGGAFAAAGLSTVVSWSSAVIEDLPFWRHDVIAIDLETRIGNPVNARDATARVVRKLRDDGMGTIYKKCDSMLRGHIGVEVAAAVASWHPSSIAIVACAFPAADRTTIGGRQHVGGIPLQQPPITKMLRDAGVSVRAADLDAVRRGSLDARLRVCREDRIDALVCDAETESDLDSIACAGARLGPNVVWVGSGGLARALPQALTLRSRYPLESARHPVALDVAPGPILFVVGSTSKIARGQAGRAIAAGARHIVAPIDALTVDDRAGARASLAAIIASALRDGNDVVVTIGELSDVGVEERPAGAALGEMLRDAAASARGLIVTGGDTATGVLRAWNTRALRLLHEIEPGVPLAMSVAPRPLLVVTKAGAFGDEESLVRTAAHLRRWCA